MENSFFADVYLNYELSLIKELFFNLCLSVSIYVRKNIFIIRTLFPNSI